MTTKNLTDGTIYVKATHHSDKQLKGWWEVTYKIDGVRALRDSNGDVLSRNSKPLYNLNTLEFTDAEIYRENWETSVSLVRTQSYRRITQADVYQLANGTLDERLIPDIHMLDPTEEDRVHEMEKAVALGYEGIVIRGKSPRGIYQWIKVVPWKTIDIRIIGFEMSTKREGFIKNFATAWGRIPATGFKVEELEEIAANGADSYVGKIIEVEFREWTKSKNPKMRFPRAARADKGKGAIKWRFDKDEESLD